MEREFALIAGCEGVRREIEDARRKADEGDFAGSEESLKRAEELRREVHALQTGLISGWEGSMTPLVAHAMDHVFNFDLEIEMTRQFTEIKRRLSILEDDA